MFTQTSYRTIVLMVTMVPRGLPHIRVSFIHSKWYSMITSRNVATVNNICRLIFFYENTKITAPSSHFRHSKSVCMVGRWRLISFYRVMAYLFIFVILISYINLYRSDFSRRHTDIFVVINTYAYFLFSLWCLDINLEIYFDNSLYV